MKAFLFNKLSAALLAIQFTLNAALGFFWVWLLLLLQAEPALLLAGFMGFDGGKNIAQRCSIIVFLRGVDVNKRTATTHSYSWLLRLRFGHYMSSCFFSFSFIGHILA